MRLHIPAPRKFIALLVAAVFVLATGPVALAMPAAPHPMMAMPGMDMETHGAMPCTHCPHHTGHNQPCKDMTHCPAMADCSGLVGLTSQAGVQLVRGHVVRSEWTRHSAAPGITRQPAHPPPIV